jgi:hypothetical protein
MKWVRLIPPVVALLVAGPWLGLQRQSIATLERGNERLRQGIASARGTGSGTGVMHASAGLLEPPARGHGRLDWQQLAAQCADMQGGLLGDLHAQMRFERFNERLQAMTREELVTALDAIAALGPPCPGRSMLEQTVIGPLIEKDPELALTHCIDSIQDDQSGLKWHLANAMREWAKKDPGKADAWLDQQIAAGKFASKSLDGRNQFRQQFEGSMMGVLLATDPAAAGRRLAAMPLGQRTEIIDGSANPATAEEQMAFTRLVREQLPVKDQTRILAVKIPDEKRRAEILKRFE